MARSKEWRLRLGPLNFGFRVRTLGLDDASPDASGSTGELPSRQTKDSREVGQIRVLEADAPSPKPVNDGEGA